MEVGRAEVLHAVPIRRSVVGDTHRGDFGRDADGRWRATERAGAAAAGGLEKALHLASVVRSRPVKLQWLMHSSMYASMASLVPPTVMLKPSFATLILPPRCRVCVRVV